MKSSIPIEISVIPAVSSLPGPIRSARRPANVDPTMIANVIGRKLRPASIGEKPRTCCRYSDTKYHIANTEDPSRKTTRFAAVSVRDEKIRSGTSGRRARRSMKTKATSSAAARRADEHGVCGDPQPLTSVRTIAKVSTTRPAVTDSAPATSKWRSPAAVRVLLGDEPHCRRAPKTPTGMLMKRIHCQPSSWVSTPPSRTPVDPPTAPIAPQ